MYIRLFRRLPVRDGSPVERRGSPVVRTLAYHAAGPSSLPGLGGVNYLVLKPGSLHWRL